MNSSMLYFLHRGVLYIVFDHVNNSDCCIYASFSTVGIALVVIWWLTPVCWEGLTWRFPGLSLPLYIISVKVTNNWNNMQAYCVTNSESWYYNHYIIAYLIHWEKTMQDCQLIEILFIIQNKPTTNQVAVDMVPYTLPKLVLY